MQGSDMGFHATMQGLAGRGTRRSSQERTALKDSSPPTTLRGRLAANRWVLLAVISIGTLMSTLDGGVVGVSYPAVAEAFDTDTSTVLWINVAFWVTSVGLLLTLGWLGDVAGRRRVFIIGYLVSTVGILLCSVSGNIWQLIAFRVLQGVGSSMVLSNLNALIAAEFPPGERGRAMGISGAVVGVGLTTGPLMGGILLDALDWRALFYVRAPIGALGALLAWWLLPAATPTGGRFRMDYMGAAALFATMTCFLLVVNQGGRLGYGSPPIPGAGRGGAGPGSHLGVDPAAGGQADLGVRAIQEPGLRRRAGHRPGALPGPRPDTPGRALLLHRRPGVLRKQDGPVRSGILHRTRFPGAGGGLAVGPVRPARPPRIRQRYADGGRCCG